MRACSKIRGGRCCRCGEFITSPSCTHQITSPFLRTISRGRARDTLRKRFSTAGRRKNSRSGARCCSLDPQISETRAVSLFCFYFSTCESKYTPKYTSGDDLNPFLAELSSTFLPRFTEIQSLYDNIVYSLRLLQYLGTQLMQQHICYLVIHLCRI